MYLTGLADEAASDIEGQIAAHRELGWTHIELRGVDKVNLYLLDDGTFDQAARAIEAAGMTVSCFGSAIANWSRHITGEFQEDRDELDRAIGRMQRMGCRFIRVMSWPNDPKAPLADRAWRDKAVRRMKALAGLAEVAGIVMVHENCSGWAGQGAEQTLELLEKVDSPALKLVWDTGNPVGHGQDSFAYYQAVRDHIVYVHVKDYKKEEDGKTRACYPGEGDGAVRRTLADLAARGYDGGVSIEPHMRGAVHLGEHAGEQMDARAIYLEYGRRLEKLVEEVMAPAAGHRPD